MIKEKDLRDQNPWWKGKRKISKDKKIKEWERTEIRYDPRLRHTIRYDFESDNTVVYTLCGPRQVGKTTLVKLQIRDFLGKGINPWNILYYSLDLVRTPEGIVELIELYLKLSARQRKNKRYYLFLDEASPITDWQNGIKWLVDSDKLINCTIMATGSQAINIKNATEKLPGRKGIIDDNYDKILPPMKFVEYASLLNQDMGELIEQNGLLRCENRRRVLKKLFTGEMDEKLDRLRAYQNETDDLLEEYMLTGGIPKVIDGKIKTNTIHESVYTTYLHGITGQWNKLSKNEGLLKQFGASMIKSQGSHVSWNSLAKNAALGNSITAIDYAATLENMLVLLDIPRYCDKQKTLMSIKDKKFYFHDPFFLHVFNGWTSPNANFETALTYLEDEINQSKIVGGIVGDHLVRLAFATSKKKQTFDYHDHVFYWKDDKNREVDFVLYNGSDIEVPIEIKYRNKINHKELAPLVNFLDRTGNSAGIVISRSTWDVRTDYVIIPASIFLLLI